MKRSGALARKTPLARSTKPLRYRSAKTAVPPATRAVVWRRDGHACVRCGETQGSLSLHHRLPRGAGGSTAPRTNGAANLILLCGSGTTGCHGWVESNRTESYDLGYLVRRGSEPAAVPVLHRTRWVQLGADGGYEGMPA